MKPLALVAAIVFVTPAAVAGEAQRSGEKRPTKIWNRTGLLGETPKHITDDYHVYGLDWTKEEIRYFVDGVLVRSVENTHWHQPLYLIFDSETMPKWFGMPNDKDLPSTFSVEYVRAWKKQ